MPAPALTTEAAFVARIVMAARSGGATEFDIATLQELLLRGREFETLKLAERLREIEASLSGMEAAECRTAVCERLGVSARRYFELRNLASAVHDRTGTR